MDDNKGPALANDILWGVKAIAGEIGVSERKAYYMLGQGYLPGQKIGDTWTASRTKLRRHLLDGEVA